MESIISCLQSGIRILFVVSLVQFDVRSEDISEKFQCVLTSEQEVALHYNGYEKYMVIDETKDAEKRITSYTVCRSLSNAFKKRSSDFVVYVVECQQLGSLLLSQLTSADIVDRYSIPAAECIASRRVVSSLSVTTAVAIATTMAVPTSTTDIPTTSTTSALPSSTATSTVRLGTDISGLVTLQVLDNTGFVVDDVATTQAIQLRIQALTTDYKSPLIDRCWYRPYSEDDFNLYEDVMFMEYGCALVEPILLESRTTPLFTSNGPLEVQTELFNLQSLYDLDFEYLTFQCEIDLCTEDQFCRTTCPATGDTYRVPPGETIRGNITSTIYVEKRQTTTVPRLEPTRGTDNPLIIRHPDAMPPPKAQKSGMDKAQPYLIIACIAVGCLILVLLCYISFRFISSSNGEPGAGGGNPQEVNKTGYHGSLPPPTVQSRMPYVGGKMMGTSPPPAYSSGTQFRGRLTSTPTHGGQLGQSMGQSMAQPLLTASPTRGRSFMPHQAELIMSPGRLNNTTLPSRYQDGTVLGGEYYPALDRSSGPLLGRDAYSWPEGQLEQSPGNVFTRDMYREPSSVEKRALGNLLAREAALKQAGSTRRELFSPSTAYGGVQSEVGNLISKSLSEYIDRHGVAGLTSHGHN